MKSYLGDGVYAEFDGWHVVLEVERDYGQKHMIFLDATVMDELIRFSKKHWELENLKVNHRCSKSN